MNEGESCRDAREESVDSELPVRRWWPPYAISPPRFSCWSLAAAERQDSERVVYLYSSRSGGKRTGKCYYYKMIGFLFAMEGDNGGSCPIMPRLAMITTKVR